MVQEIQMPIEVASCSEFRAQGGILMNSLGQVVGGLDSPVMVVMKEQDGTELVEHLGGVLSPSNTSVRSGTRELILGSVLVILPCNSRWDA